MATSPGAGVAAATASSAESLKELQRLLDNEAFEDVVRLATKMPPSLEQTKALTYAALQCSRWPQALEAIRAYAKNKLQTEASSPASRGSASTAEGKAAAALCQEFAIEEAYCQYRLNHPQHAMQILREIKSKLTADKELAALHLEAQLRHRLGGYREAREIYEKILTKEPDNEMLVVNYLSAFTCENQRNWLWSLGPPLQPALSKTPASVARCLSSSRVETFELFFNAACLAVDERRFEEAETWLDRAQVQWAKENGVPAEEAEAAALQSGEAAGLYVQRAVLRQMRGGSDAELRSIYSSVLEAAERKDAGVEVTVAAVAQTNLSALDSADKAETAGSLDAALKRANRRQSQALGQKLSTAQFKECRRLLSSHTARYGSSFQLEMLSAALQIASNRMQKGEEALKALAARPLVSDSPRSALRVKLAVAALRLLQGDKEGTMRLLREAQPLLFAPEVIGERGWSDLLRTVFKLLQQAGETILFLQTFAEGRNEAFKGPDRTEAFVVYCLTAADAAASLGDWKASCTYCQEALQKIRASPAVASRGEDSRSPSPIEFSVLLKLFEAQCQVDVTAARQSFVELERQLPVSLGLLDAEEVERRQLPPLKRSRRAGLSSASIGVAEAAGAATANRPSVRKRKRKPRLPKGFDPSKPSIPPDPERWLPKHERSGAPPVR